MAWDFWQYWYYNIPNYLLAALSYTMLGRFLLGFFVPDEWNNYIWQAFIRLTNPVVAVVRYITPLVVTHLWILILAALWLHLIRIGFTIIMLSFGLIPIIDTSVEPLPR
ncbi:MAG: YggT family protein [Rhodospirillales bacterium]|nr:YggT family protein [Rhodospirillales bacterium]